MAEFLLIPRGWLGKSFLLGMVSGAALMAPAWLLTGCGASQAGVSPVPTECPQERVVHPSVAMIERDGGGRHCTAWAFAPRRLLTNNHCIGDSTEGLKWKGRRFIVLRRGSGRQDYVVLALLPGEPSVVPLPLDGEPGSESYLIGAGCTGDTTVQRKRLVAPGAGRRGCVCHGDSGAPVVDASGRAWGMNKSAWARSGPYGSGAHLQALERMELR